MQVYTHLQVHAPKICIAYFSHKYIYCTSPKFVYSVHLPSSILYSVLLQQVCILIFFHKYMNIFCTSPISMYCVLFPQVCVFCTSPHIFCTSPTLICSVLLKQVYILYVSNKYYCVLLPASILYSVLLKQVCILFFFYKYIFCSSPTNIYFILMYFSHKYIFCSSPSSMHSVLLPQVYILYFSHMYALPLNNIVNLGLYASHSISNCKSSGSKPFNNDIKAHSGALSTFTVKEPYHCMSLHGTLSPTHEQGISLYLVPLYHCGHFFLLAQFSRNQQSHLSIFISDASSFFTFSVYLCAFYSRFNGLL